MLEIAALDLDEIASALADQASYNEYAHLINPATGELALWTEDGGIDGTNPVDLDDLDLVAIDPLPSHVWYQDMADFTSLLSDSRAAQNLTRALNGRGPFRRFKNELYERHPALVSSWQNFRETRATRRAVEWLRDGSLITPEAAATFLTAHPDPAVP